jgi:hypothetical protein
MMLRAASGTERVKRRLLVAGALTVLLINSCAVRGSGPQPGSHAAVGPSTVPPGRATPSFPKGIARFGATDFGAMAGAGFTFTTDGNDDTILNQLGSSGLSGLVWLGAWNNNSCSWEYSDSKVADIVDSVRRNPHVLAYQVGDEPDPKACPNAPDAYAARTALVHQRDPAGQTLTILDQFDDSLSGPVSAAPSRFKGAVDIPAFDVYPCLQGRASCDFQMIDRAISAIRLMNLPRWWAVLQDFQYGQWRWPTPSELDRQFKAWAGSGMSGYLVFAWDYKGSRITSQPGHVAQLSSSNSSLRDH